MMKKSLGTGLIFDGESQDVEKFINQFTLEALMFGWDEAAQAKAIKLYLEGKALKYYNELTSSEKNNIEDVFKGLKDKCGKPPNYYFSLFYNKEIKQDESIASFCHAIESYLEKATPGMDQLARERILIGRLMEKAPESVRGTLVLLGDKSWKELVTIFDKSVDYRSIKQ